MSMSYHLTCPVCHQNYEDTYLLNCPAGCPSLLRAEYADHRLTIRDLPGVFRFSDWLPVKGALPTRSAPVCFKSIHLARYLGLSDLWIGFSGYWPEKGAYVTSGSFKEFEALPTVVRLRERKAGVILVASAGNTGRAFAQVSAETGQPVIVVAPEKARDRIWTSIPAVHLLLITVDGDYTDAITIGNELCHLSGVIPEGGAKNVARRDGMGTVMLEAAVTMGTMPEWYVQAVGSGTGGIAAWEASVRLLQDGRFGNRLPRLYLIQNDPFVPMVNAWHGRRREIIADTDMPNPRRSIEAVHADVLTNRAPPYGIAGGVFDALQETNGLMDAVTSDEAFDFGVLFSEIEGIDPDPAAAVCVAGLSKAVQKGIIRPDDKILLNITGGGTLRYRKDTQVTINPPSLSVSPGTQMKDIIDIVGRWVNQYV